jgi:hypothetical protein
MPFISSIDDHRDDRALKRLVKRHLNLDAIRGNGWVLFDNDRIIAYCMLRNNRIDWIWAQAGHGTPFLRRIERLLSRDYDSIVMSVSIDPTESKSTVLRRLNFYIKNDYRVVDVKYRATHGPLLSMKKVLTND